MLPALNPLGQCSTTGTENKLEYPPTKPHRPACPSATKPRPLSEGGLHGTSRRLDSCSRVLHSFVNHVPVTALRCQFPTPPMQGELSVNDLKEAGLTGHRRDQKQTWAVWRTDPDRRPRETACLTEVWRGDPGGLGHLKHSALVSVYFRPGTNSTEDCSDRSSKKQVSGGK